MLGGLLTMSTEETDRLAIIQKVIDKGLKQLLAAKQLGLTIRQVKRLGRVDNWSHPTSSRGLIITHKSNAHLSRLRDRSTRSGG